jgi:D-aminopeptidase
MKVRENGWIIGKLPTGEKNCITDVNGVMVGHVTLDFSLDETGENSVTTKGRAGRVVQKIPL